MNNRSKIIILAVNIIIILSVINIFLPKLSQTTTQHIKTKLTLSSSDIKINSENLQFSSKIDFIKNTHNFKLKLFDIKSESKLFSPSIKSNVSETLNIFILNFVSKIKKRYYF